jgi:hypothetical protein
MVVEISSVYKTDRSSRRRVMIKLFPLGRAGEQLWSEQQEQQ